MKKTAFGNGSVIIISTLVILGIILVGLTTFNITAKFEQDRLLADLSGPYVLNPDNLPAPGAGLLRREPENSLGCEGFVFRSADSGIHYVRESGGGRYFAAEVNNRFGIYILNYGYLLRIQNSSLDTATYRKLKYALYHCGGTFTRTGVRIVVSSPENTQA